MYAMLRVRGHGGGFREVSMYAMLRVTGHDGSLRPKHDGAYSGEAHLHFAYRGQLM